MPRASSRRTDVGYSSGIIDIDEFRLPEHIPHASTTRLSGHDLYSLYSPAESLETIKLRQEAGRAVPCPGCWAKLRDERGNPGCLHASSASALHVRSDAEIGCQELGPCNTRINLV